MNMNDKDWNEFWDDEPDGDDEFNDVGSDIDANNDETFDNAAEWNEDEHEEMIARDSILSHTIRSNNHTIDTRSSENARLDNCSNNDVNTNSINGVGRVNGASVSDVIDAIDRSSWGAFPALGRHEPSQAQSANSWQAVQETTERIHLLQLQQQQLIIQKQLQEQEHQRHQQQRDRQMFERRMKQDFAERQSSGPQICPEVLTVDQLESQLLNSRITAQEPTGLPSSSKRTGWSPFGGKDIFASSNSTAQAEASAGLQKIIMHGQWPRSSTAEQQQQIIMQQHVLQQSLQHQQQMAILKGHRIQQEQREMLRNPQCFMVEDLERQMIKNRSDNTRIQAETVQNAKQTIQDVASKPNRNSARHDTRNNVYNGHEKHEHDQREGRDHRNRREFRDQWDRRDSRQPKKSSLTIIPPKVQLSVLDKAKRLFSLTTMHSDEFLQDRMPTSNEGFLFTRHSVASNQKVNHDGVLTEKERAWLTKIQEKIQADYDDNLDQDYYYLLYFNRSSIVDEAGQKPSGPSVLDRRFIPRERLLYNTNT